MSNVGNFPRDPGMNSLGGRHEPARMTWDRGGRGWRAEAGELRLERRSWRVESGEWKLESGCWRVECGEGRVENEGWRVEAGEWRLEQQRLQSRGCRVELAE